MIALSQMGVNGQIENFNEGSASGTKTWAYDKAARALH
jgi:hypothetical protein